MREDQKKLLMGLGYGLLVLVLGLGGGIGCYYYVLGQMDAAWRTMRQDSRDIKVPGSVELDFEGGRCVVWTKTTEGHKFPPEAEPHIERIDGGEVPTLPDPDDPQGKPGKGTVAPNLLDKAKAATMPGEHIQVIGFYALPKGRYRLTMAADILPEGVSETQISLGPEVRLASGWVGLAKFGTTLLPIAGLFVGFILAKGAVVSYFERPRDGKPEANETKG